MSTKLSSLLLLALLLVHCEMIMLGEAAMCKTRSRNFRGLCFRNSNCATICEKEGYLFGKCKTFRCTCTTNCNGGGQGKSPPAGGNGGQIPPGGEGGDQSGDASQGGDGGDANQGGDGGDASQGGDDDQGPQVN